MLALIFVVPADSPVTTPAATEAIAELSLDQVTVALAGVGVATNVVVASSAIETVCLSSVTP